MNVPATAPVLEKKVEFTESPLLFGLRVGLTCTCVIVTTVPLLPVEVSTVVITVAAVAVGVGVNAESFALVVVFGRTIGVKDEEDVVEVVLGLEDVVVVVEIRVEEEEEKEEESVVVEDVDAEVVEDVVLVDLDEVVVVEVVVVAVEDEIIDWSEEVVFVEVVEVVPDVVREEVRADDDVAIDDKVWVVLVVGGIDVVRVLLASVDIVPDDEELDADSIPGSL